MNVHPIEAESYRILDARVDLSHLLPLERAVVARVIHASADLEFADSLVASEPELVRAVAALAAGAPVVVDVAMVSAGITALHTHCFLDRVTVDAAPTRSAAAMRLAVSAFKRDAVFVVGCAPSALVELVDMADDRDFDPVLVIGMPVGFVGATESKEALRASRLPAVTNMGEKGGSAVAAAALNALIRAGGVGTGVEQ